MDSIYRKFAADDVNESDIPWVQDYPGHSALPLVEEFFEAQPNNFFGTLKRYTGTAWVNGLLKNFATVFAPKPVKRFDGTAWVEINATGV